VLAVLAIGFFSLGRYGSVSRRPGRNPAPPVAELPVPEPPPSTRPPPPPRIAKPAPRGVAAPVRPDDRRAELRLKVVGVHDGDSLTGLDDGRIQYKIRLQAIDAPELGQPFGQAAKRALSGKVFGRDVVVIPQTTDRFGRTVGRVLVAGRDAALEMLEEGMAWHYEQYDDEERLREAERAARAARKGLWQDRSPEPPWQWRKQGRTPREGG